MLYLRLFAIFLALFFMHANVLADEPKKLEEYLKIEIKTATCFKDEKTCTVKGIIKDKVLGNILRVDDVTINQATFVDIGQIETQKEKEKEEPVNTISTPDSVSTSSTPVVAAKKKDLRMKIKIEAILIDGKEFEVTAQSNEEIVFHNKFEKIAMACHQEIKNHPFVKLEIDNPESSDGFDVQNMLPYYQFDYYPEIFRSGYTRHVIHGKLINMRNKKEIFGFTAVVSKTYKELLYTNQGTLRSYAWVGADDSVNFETQFPQFDPDGTPQTVYVTALREVFKQPTMVIKLSEIEQ
jgi:hypothetical protein